MKIFKYLLNITDVQHVPLTKGSKILSVGLDTVGSLCLWALVNPNEVIDPETIEIYGTGNLATSIKDSHKFLGTVIQGTLVWHIFHRMK